LFNFPSEYIGTLTGAMWTAVGVIVTVQYSLVKLTDNITLAWRVCIYNAFCQYFLKSFILFSAWVIILSLVILMSCHLIQLWWKYVRDLRKKSTINVTEEIGTKF
jgi:hypothetical protein